MASISQASSSSARPTGEIPTEHPEESTTPQTPSSSASYIGEVSSAAPTAYPAGYVGVASSAAASSSSSRGRPLESLGGVTSSGSFSAYTEMTETGFQSSYESISRAAQGAFSWNIGVASQLFTHFGASTITPLGKGKNSSAFTMTDAEGNIHVLRVFPSALLKHEKTAKNYILSAGQRIGGEILSILAEHPNIATNTHILFWDEEEGLKLYNREEALGLINNLPEGRTFYAVATVGGYVSNSADLKSAIKTRTFSDSEIKFIIKELVKGIQFLHSQGISHRDLKAENIILIFDDDQNIIGVKLIDFGSSRKVTRPEEGCIMSTDAGDPLIRPSETITAKKGAGKEADSYAFFLLIYHLVTGEKYIPIELESYTSSRAFFKDLRAFHHESLEKTSTYSEMLAHLTNDPRLKDVSDSLIQLMAAFGPSDPGARRRMTSSLLGSSYFLSESGD